MRVEPRRADAKVGADRPDGRVLPGLREELLDDGRELLEVASAGILNLHREAAGGAQAPDRRRVEGEDKRLRDLGEFPERRPDQRLHMLVGTRAFVPEVQGKEHGRGIGAARVEHKVLADQRIRAVDHRVGQEVLLKLAHHLGGPLQGSAVGKLDDGNKVALVLLRQEAGR